MDIKVMLVYCLCADLLIALHPTEDPQCQMSDADVMTTAIVAALFFGGKYERARELLQEQGYIPPWLRALLAHYRNQVERVPTGRGSLIERLLPKSIHAITAKGFELKVILFTLAASINCLYLTLAALYYHEVFLGHNLGYYAVDGQDAEFSVELRIDLMRRGRQLGVVDSFVAAVTLRYD